MRISGAATWSALFSILSPLGLFGGVVVQWHLDEGSGTDILDSSTNNNHGVHVGDPVHVTGKFGGGVELDTNDTLVSNGSLVLPANGPFTAALWFNRSAADNEGVLFRNGQFSIQYEANSHVRGYIHLNGSWSPTSTVSAMPALDTWEHYALVWDTSTLLLYHNGVAAPSGSGSGLLTNGDGGNDRLYVGSYVFGAPWDAPGRFDEAILFDEALSPAQIGNLVSSNSLSGVPEASEALLGTMGLGALLVHRRRRKVPSS